MSNETPEGGQPQQPEQPYGAYPPPPPPSPYPPAGYPPAGFAPLPLKRTKGLATALTVFVAVDVVVSLLTALLSPVVAHDLELLKDGVTPDSPAVFWTAAGLAGLDTIALLVAAILTMIWTTQVRTNAEILSPEVNHARSKVWAALGWIVPVVSLWFPFQVIRDVRRALDPREEVRRGVPMAGLVQGWWWFFFLVTNILGNVESRVSSTSSAVTTSDIISARYLDPIVGLTTLAAGIMWIVIIRSIESNQAERIRQVRGG